MPTHAERKVVAYSAEQLFDLVADVGKYPAFLPWCIGARVRTRTETELVADLTIGFGPFRESFTSRVGLERPGRILVRYENGPFRYLKNRWIFKPEQHGCPEHHGCPEPHGCMVDFYVDFEFRSRILQAAIGVVFHEAVRRMVNAFLKRARDVYGAPGANASAAAPASATAPAEG
jgi:coenzyme Q-binding protein COQ10